LFIKYFPALGIHYDVWNGAPEYAGVALSKNTLGGACLFSGLTFFWDTATRWSNRSEGREKRTILLNVAFLAMTFWLLKVSNSATSRTCLLLGCLLMIASHSRMFRRRQWVFQLTIPLAYVVYVIVAFGLGLNQQLASALGRDPTFTGRTVIWKAVMSTDTNPLVGTGYESFWLGPRVRQVWAQTGPGINEAHNSYLDVYVNLGIVGLCLLLCFLIASYKRICRELRRFSSLGSLGVAAWAATVFAGTTEVVMKNGLPWMLFLLGASLSGVSYATRLSRAGPVVASGTDFLSTPSIAKERIRG